jgi:hypothetical protein
MPPIGVGTINTSPDVSAIAFLPICVTLSRWTDACLLTFHDEEDLRVDTEILRPVILDRGLELVDVDRSDAAQGGGGLGNRLPRRILPAFLARRAGR